MRQQRSIVFTKVWFSFVGLALFGCADAKSTTAENTAENTAADTTPAPPSSNASNSSSDSSATAPAEATNQTGADPSEPGDGEPETGPAGLSNEGETDVPPAPPTNEEVTACRAYYATICARIRECGASTFRPCESPIDLCPDILFGTASTWTVDDVRSCTAAWTTHDCDELNGDIWPACATHPGTREDSEPCAFSSECSSGVCKNALSETFLDACGQCVTPAQPDAPCSDETPCINGYFCSDGSCQPYFDNPLQPPDCGECGADEECYRGACVTVAPGPLPEGAVCSPLTLCAEGLGCGIELVDDEANEPKQGTCQPLPPIGSGCLPTFVSTGLCADGGTCDSRPTGTCVALKEIGDYCGYASCVEEAFCQVNGIPDEVLPSHTCYERFSEGDSCYLENEDYLCKDHLGCRCAEPGCAPTCVHLGQAGEPCAGPEDCEVPICADGTCVDTDDANDGSIGSFCARTSDLGRVDGTCIVAGGVECLCTDASCGAARCARPREEGETCNAITDLCRRGFACSDGRCIATGNQDLRARVCGVE